MESALRTLRVVYLAFLAGAGLYIFFVGEQFSKAKAENIDDVLYSAIIIWGLTSAVIGVKVRSHLVRSAEAQLRITENEPAALTRWRAGQIIGFAFGEALVFYGFLVRFLGGSLVQAAPLYALGIILLLMLRPRRPAADPAQQPESRT
jgi:hypothetical protein